MSKDFWEEVEGIVGRDPRYGKEAYGFVMEALHFTQGKLEKTRHLTGQELLEGIKEYGLKQYGRMTRTVFEHWGIMKTGDFGEIVFNMVNAGLLKKTDEDSIDDFKNVYDFEETFGKKL